MSIPRKVIVSLLVVLAAAFAGAACGGDDKPKEAKLDDSNPENPGFHVATDATRFGGPVPLAIKFKAQPFNAKGPVHYRWRFDDGTTSEERTPVKIFKKAGYYQVLMEARDTKGADAWNLIVGAWPPELWNAQEKSKGPATSTSIRKLQGVQGRLTGKRRNKQVAASKRRAAKYRSSKPAT